MALTLERLAELETIVQREGDPLIRYLFAELRRGFDDPETDGTDLAHPAWWRGTDSATRAVEGMIGEALGATEGRTLQELLDEVRALRTGGRVP